MTVYRLYHFDGMARIVAADYLQSETDSMAIALAARRQNRYSMELWCLDRFIMAFDAKPRLTPSIETAAHVK